MNKYIATPLLVLLLQGCGSSVLIKQETTSAITAGQNATTEVNKFYDHIFNKQNELAAYLIASNTSCQYLDPILVRRNYNGKNTLCLSQSEIREWQKDKSIGYIITLTPSKKSSLKTSMDILEAFSIYLEALSKNTSAPDTPIAGALQGAVTELTAINKKLEFLSNETSGKLAQSTAVTDLIAYLEKLIKNSTDANEIKRIIETEGAKQDKNLLAVASEADITHTEYVASISSTLSTVMANYYNQNINSTEFNTLEKRKIFLTTAINQRQLSEQIRTSSSPAAIAIRKFTLAHNKLRDAITGNYSEEQKAFIVDENTKELKDGLQNLASLIQFAISIGI